MLAIELRCGNVQNKRFPCIYIATWKLVILEQIVYLQEDQRRCERRTLIAVDKRVVAAGYFHAVLQEWPSPKGRLRCADGRFRKALVAQPRRTAMGREYSLVYPFYRFYREV